MAAPGQTKPDSLSWACLPAEIRGLILQAIARQKHPGWASLASVCREWQSVFEHANFDKLKLRVSRLDDFSRIASPQRRHMIRHICLDVELPRYTCDDCARRLSTWDDTSPVVSDAVWKLFSILSAWEPAGGLALELNAYSPSDRDHWFKDIHLSTDDVEEDEDSNTPLDAWRTEPRCHDPDHGWFRGRRAVEPPRSAVMRLFRPIILRFQKPLPQVRAVTRFLLRRQFRRCVCPSDISLLLDSLVRVERMVYESWGLSGPSGKQVRQQAVAFMVRDGLPGTLKSLTIFEDSYELYNRFPRRLSDIHWLNLFPDGLQLGATFAFRSRNLQHLSISFLINAEELFRHCQPAWNWPHMQSLALTSDVLDQEERRRRRISLLLRRAGRMAQRMPKLHTFVLWNGGRGHACAFIYRVDKDGVAITWRATWRLALAEDPLVIREWRLAAARLRFTERFTELQIKQQRIFRDISSHGDAIYRLKLPCQVIEPASLWQIRREGHRPAR
ncbi:hypothetical protein CCMA1212_001365 [Trichoderma ghanense]|uniref:DUF6546 domain-containing protein n=1 Tax=Trichoderma ghanense TaxID=65468 RepID=A0ABY2HE87_9HYPO